MKAFWVGALFFILITIILLVLDIFNQDDCLRAIRAIHIFGTPEAAQSFCSIFTTSCVTNAADGVYGSCDAKPTTTKVTVASPSTTEAPTRACGELSALWAAQIAVKATPTAAASLAYECLNSVGIQKEGALRFVDELKPYLEWQSDTAFIKDPPADYFYPPHDLFAELSKLRTRIETDQYPSEYSWQLDLYKNIFGPAHHGHLVVYPDLLTRVVEWQRPFALVSISNDGSSLPHIKLYDDVISSPDTASVVRLINGVNARKFVENWVFQVSSHQDPNAAYNSMFFSKPFHAGRGARGYFETGGRMRYIYPGEATTITLQNGTFLNLPNTARLKGNWSGVVDGPSLFEVFCDSATSSADLGNYTSANTPNHTAAPSAAVAASVLGYPTPVVISSDSKVSGYFIKEKGFEDVAILVMLSFFPKDPSEFQRVVQEFLAISVAEGKTKLIIDLQANGGGYILQGYDTFRQMFPDIVQEGLSRQRTSAGFLAISQVFSTVCATFDPSTANEDLINKCNSVYNWRHDLNISLGSFTSFADKFGPINFKDDNSTNLMQWDFDNPFDTMNSTYGIGYDVTGYGSRRNLTRPFRLPENLVVLLDGYCASTCTLFAQFLRHDAGVKSIAIGGRPKEGLIQGVGGVKGARSHTLDSIYSHVQLALRDTNDSAVMAELVRYTAYVSNRSSVAALNVKDEILHGNLDDGTPAQFVVENSDCRLYWTASTLRDMTSLWKVAATAAFNGGKCASGGIERHGAGQQDTQNSAVLFHHLKEKTPRQGVDLWTEKIPPRERRMGYVGHEFMHAID